MRVPWPNVAVTSSVATPPATDRERTLVPAGIVVLTPAARSALVGPSSSVSRAARTGVIVAGTVRLVSQSWLLRANQS